MNSKYSSSAATSLTWPSASLSAARSRPSSPRSSTISSIRSSLIIGGLDFSGVTVGVFPIGDLIMSIINFLCISFVVFWMVKIINRFNRKKEKEPEPEAPAKPTTDELLADILAELKLQNGRAEAAKTLDAAGEEESSDSGR